MYTNFDTKELMTRSIHVVLALFITCQWGLGQLPVPVPSPLQIGAYLPGLIGPRDYVDPEFSGLVVMDYNIFFNADKYIDRNGNAVDRIDLSPRGGAIPIDVELSGYVNALDLGYVTPEIRWLGNARYIAAAVANYSTADVRARYSLLGRGGAIEGSAGGIGDLMVTPLLLTWTLGERRWDITAGYFFSAPTGRYATGASDNVGLGYWNHLFQLFTYYYPLPEKATAIFFGNTLEVHGKIKDVDIRPGSRYVIDYGISQYLTPWLEVIVQGGNAWQVSQDSGRDVFWDASVKDSYGVIGGGLGFWPIQNVLYGNIKYLTNYAERQHFNTQYWEIQLVWVPWKRKERTPPVEIKSGDSLWTILTSKY